MDGRDPWIGHSIEPDRASHVSVLSPMFLFPSSYLADSGRSHMDIKTMIDASANCHARCSSDGWGAVLKVV